VNTLTRISPDAIICLNGVLSEHDTLFLSGVYATASIFSAPSSPSFADSPEQIRGISPQIPVPEEVFHVPLFHTIPTDSQHSPQDSQHSQHSPHSQGRFPSLSHTPLIAADGAATKLRLLGIMPNAIIGDLDSLRAERSWWEQQQCTLRELADQNSTDFEKCLEFAREQGWTRLLVFGVHGGDLDHTLNNWSIVSRYGNTALSGLRLCLADNGKMALPLFASCSLHITVNAMISLLPQPFVRLTTSGLEWELQRETLALGTREGARNRARLADITLTLHEGAVLLVVESALPQMLAAL
jgi:thiamine pyrophosphokinase